VGERDQVSGKHGCEDVSGETPRDAPNDCAGETAQMEAAPRTAFCRT
jgi:hypothetical protein